MTGPPLRGLVGREIAGSGLATIRESARGNPAPETIRIVGVVLPVGAILAPWIAALVAGRSIAYV